MEYEATAVKPERLHVRSAAATSSVTVIGFEFFNTRNITCRWGGDGEDAIATVGVFQSPGALDCPLPAALPPVQPGGVARLRLDVSLAGGANGTLAATPGIALFQCSAATEPECGGHGACSLPTGAGAPRCACDAGWGGPGCGVRCPAGAGGSVCSGHGDCLPASGKCACGDGWAGQACDEPVSSCPAGRFAPAGPGGACSGTCPGSSGCAEGVGGACGVVCGGRGRCLAGGSCACNASAGFFGPGCDQSCPSGGGGGAVPCGGPGRGGCGGDGRCDCLDGFAGPACELQCPLGANPIVAGLEGPCSGAGTCDAKTGACLCRQGAWGPACDGVCRGTSNCQAGPPLGFRCETVCSGAGACDAGTGSCSCAAGSWGSACEVRCDCEQGVCNGTDGSCACLSGWVGDDCSVPCPTDARGRPCGGQGRCVAGRLGPAECACNAGWGGQACGERVCVEDCYGRGTCVGGGVCKCDDGWLAPTCARPEPRSAGGVVQWRESPGGVPREAGTLRVAIVREGSNRGAATATWRCGGGTAAPGRDYECGGNRTVSWADGEDGARTAAIEILSPVGAVGPSAGEVSFDVEIVAVAPRGVAVGGRAAVTVLLVPPSLERLLRDNVRVTFRLAVAYAEVTRAGSDPAAGRFREELVEDLTGSLAVASSRLAVTSVVPALSGSSTLCTLLILRPGGRLAAAPSEASAGAPAPSVASALVLLIGDANSSLYRPERAWSRFVDVSFAPVVETVDAPPAPPAPTAAVQPWVVAVAVLLPLAALVGLGALCHRRRRDVAEWVLWRAGQMRFSSLPQTEHRAQLELELGELSDEEERGVGTERRAEGGAADGRGNGGAGDGAPLHAASAASTGWGRLDEPEPPAPDDA